MTAQLILPMRDLDRATMALARLRCAVRSVADQIGIKALAEDWDCSSERKVTDKIEQRDRHYLKPEELIDLILRDRSGQIISELCELAGYDTPERKHLKTEAEKFTSLDAAIESLGPEVADMLRRKAGNL